MSTWIATKNIIENPQLFHNKKITMLSQYSLIHMGDNITKPKSFDRIFNKYDVIEYTRQENITHILLKIDSINDAKMLENHLRYEGMVTLPDIGESKHISTDHYIIDMLLPDGIFYKVSQSVRSY